MTKSALIVCFLGLFALSPILGCGGKKDPTPKAKTPNTEKKDDSGKTTPSEKEPNPATSVEPVKIEIAEFLPTNGALAVSLQPKSIADSSALADLGLSDRLLGRIRRFGIEPDQVARAVEVIDLKEPTAPRALLIQLETPAKVDAAITVSKLLSGEDFEPVKFEGRDCFQVRMPELPGDYLAHLHENRLLLVAKKTDLGAMLDGSAKDSSLAKLLAAAESRQFVLVADYNADPDSFQKVLSDDVIENLASPYDQLATDLRLVKEATIIFDADNDELAEINLITADEEASDKLSATCAGVNVGLHAQFVALEEQVGKFTKDEALKKLFTANAEEIEKNLRVEQKGNVVLWSLPAPKDWQRLAPALGSVTNPVLDRAFGDPSAQFVENSGWVRHADEEKGYAVWFPGEPETADGEAVNFLSPSSGAHYTVMFSEFEEDEILGGPDPLLDGMVESMSDASESTRKLDLHGHPGRELKLVYPGEDIAVKSTHRIYLVGTKMYQVIIAAPESAEIEQESKRFLNSFELLGSALTSQSGASPLRVWLDITRQRRITAEFVGVKDGEVQLRNETGELIVIPTTQLSESDRKLVAQMTSVPEEVAPETNKVWLLGDAHPWPQVIERSPQSASSTLGLQLREPANSVLRTIDTGYATKDFHFEVLVSLVRGPGVCKFGVGTGELEATAALLISQPNDESHGMVRLGDSFAGGEQIGEIPLGGTHRLSFTKRGDDVVLSIDVYNDGLEENDIQTEVKLGEFAPKLGEDNSSLFIGGAGLLHTLNIDLEPATTPEPLPDDSEVE